MLYVVLSIMPVGLSMCFASALCKAHFPIICMLVVMWQILTLLGIPLKFALHLCSVGKNQDYLINVREQDATNIMLHTSLVNWITQQKLFKMTELSDL